MNEQVLQLKKQVRQLQFAVLGFLAVFAILALSAFGKKKDQIIRAKGIIIEDSAGRDRILIGAPIPYSGNRVRTDTSLVRKYWANTFPNPDQYMKWYASYRNSVVGMVVMNEKGFDRLQFGDKVADPNIGQRMFESAGVFWNDKEGWERGGAGVNTTQDGKSRSVMGVDASDGEAVHIVALEDGSRAMVISGDNGHLMIGMSKENGQWFENKEPFTGIKFFDKKWKLVWEQEMKKNP
jgi:hypothetical protein